MPLDYLRCSSCAKTVSTGFFPVATEMGPTLVVRAWVECPECVEARERRAAEQRQLDVRNRAEADAFERFVDAQLGLEAGVGPVVGEIAGTFSADAPGPALRCSFCGKGADDVGMLVAGGAVAFICDGCVEVCAEIVTSESGARAEQMRRRDGDDERRPAFVDSPPEGER